MVRKRCHRLMGFQRNLTAGEIVAQVMTYAPFAGDGSV
jgi:adenine C2-methylase RlmN of 23S rRNA A2503 and tRNA A37